MVGTTMDFDGVPKHLTEQQEELVQKPGGGNYEFRNFSLLLGFSDGRVRRMSACAPPKDNSRQPKRLVVQDKALVRKRVAEFAELIELLQIFEGTKI